MSCDLKTVNDQKIENEVIKMNFNMQSDSASEIKTLHSARLKGQLDAQAGRTPQTISVPELQAAYDDMYGQTIGIKDAKYIGQFGGILEVFNRPGLFKAYYDAFASAIGESDALNSSPPRDFSDRPRLQEIYNQQYKNTAKKLGVSDDITGPGRSYSWDEAQKCYDQGRVNNVKLMAHSDAQKGEKPFFANKNDPKLEKIYLNEYYYAYLKLNHKLPSYPKNRKSQ